MINGSFVFGFHCDKADVFDRTVEFAVARMGLMPAAARIFQRVLRVKTKRDSRWLTADDRPAILHEVGPAVPAETPWWSP